MTAVILTWDREDNIRVVSDENDKDKVFESVEVADCWREDNTGELDGYSRIIDLDD